MLTLRSLFPFSGKIRLSVALYLQPPEAALVADGRRLWSGLGLCICAAWIAAATPRGGYGTQIHCPEGEARGLDKGERPRGRPWAQDRSAGGHVAGAR